MYLHHYFNSENGPFLSISDLPPDEALKAFHKMVRFLTERDGGYITLMTQNGILYLIDINNAVIWNAKCAEDLLKKTVPRQGNIHII